MFVWAVSAATPPTSSPQGPAILVAHENRLAVGGVVNSTYLKVIIFVESDQCHLVAHLGREALLLGEPPGLYLPVAH